MVIDHWAPSSKACSGCRYVLPDLPLSIRSWTCSGCGADHDRNVKASRNLLAWASGWGGGSPKSCGAVRTPEGLAA